MIANEFNKPGVIMHPRDFTDVDNKASNQEMHKLINKDEFVENLLTKDTPFTPEEIEFLTEKLSSKFWRLNNLYTIKDKHGVKRKLKLNNSQIKVLKKFKHNKKIILKSRQQGISTLFVAYYLDDCIFKPGFEAGIQSYGRDEAEKLSMRAELMWNDMDPHIKKLVGITLNHSEKLEPASEKEKLQGELFLRKNNSSGLYFSNGSILKIGNFRGDTLQGLHVSELGKIAKKFPEKAKELKNGAFQAVSVNNKITIESTAEGKSGLFYKMWVKAQFKSDNNIPLSPLDFQAIFLPWYDDPDCHIFVEQPISNEFKEYFSKLEKELNITIEDSYKWWYVSKSDELEEDMKQEYPSTPEEAFQQSIEGTYYKEEYKNLKVIKGAYDQNLVVYSAWDLGVNDDMSIGFFQFWEEERNGEKILRKKMIGEYYNSGKGLDFYREIFRSISKKYGWEFHNAYVPHDIAVFEMTSSKTRFDRMVELGFKPIKVNKHKVIDGIEATRSFLKECEFDEKCEKAILAIQMYRKKKDEKFDVFLDSPVHDEHSHPADMIRYMAMGCKYTTPSLFYVYDLVKPIQNYDIFKIDGYDI